MEITVNVLEAIYLNNYIYLYSHRADRFCKNPENQANEIVTGSGIIADSHTNIDAENAMLQTVLFMEKNKNYNNQRFDIYRSIYQNKNTS